MNTFLPWPEFHWSAQCLDDETLGEQRLDTLQIMQALLHGWSRSDDHPAVLMWEDYERALLAYQQAICHEWVKRGFEDDCWDRTRLMFLDVVVDPMKIPLIPPPWLGNVDLHISHQSNLLNKNEEHYRRHFPGITKDRPYIWPVVKEKN